MRFLAVLCAALAIAALVADAVATGPGGFALRSIGELWFTYDRESWLLLQPAIERHVHQDLWFAVFEPVFRQSAVLVAGGAAAAFFVLSAVVGRR